MRIVLYTGKGGVGKTTTAAATAVRAARIGRRTLVASTDAAHSLGDVFGCELSARPRELLPDLYAVEVDPRRELDARWAQIRRYLADLLAAEGIEGLEAEDAARLPGADELMTLVAAERMAREVSARLLVVDCAPTDGALRLVTFPDVARSLVRLLLRVQRVVAAAAAPLARRLGHAGLPDGAALAEIERFVYRDLRRLHRRITAPSCSVRLVLNPDRMSVREARRAHADLSLFGVPVDAVIANRVLPETLGGALRGWVDEQEARLAGARAAFEPLPVLTAPLRDDEVVGVAALDRHGAELFGSLAPDAVLGRAPRIRFSRCAGGARAVVPLPGADPRLLEVATVDDELVIRSGPRRRAIPLPRSLLGFAVRRAEYRDQALRIELERESRGARSGGGGCG